MNDPQPPQDGQHFGRGTGYPPADQVTAPSYPIPPRAVPEPTTAAEPAPAAGPVPAAEPGYPAVPPSLHARSQPVMIPRPEPSAAAAASPSVDPLQPNHGHPASTASRPSPYPAETHPAVTHPPASYPAEPYPAGTYPPATYPQQPADPASHAVSPPVAEPYRPPSAAGNRTGLSAPPPAPAPVMDPHPHHATDWTYTPRQASIASRPTPAEWGWRARLAELSGGLIKLSPGPEELLHRSAVARIRSTLPGSRTVVVANEKGGAGKTPTALILSALLAEYRREAVVAWDVNELRGTLGLRAQVTDPPLTVTDVLAAAGELARPEAEVGVLSAYLRRQPEGNLVLASSEDGNAMRQIGHAECDIVRQLLLRRYGVVVCDTGNNAAAPNFLYTVDSADVLVLPTAPSDVHLEVARAMLRMLASRETTSHLVARAVLVVTSSTGARLEPEEERWFVDRIGRVVHVPADPIIAQGGKLTIAELSQTSIRAWTQVAGAVIEAAQAPSPHDRPAGRRRAPDSASAPLPDPPTHATLNGQPAGAPSTPPLSAGWIPVTPPPAG